MPLFCPRPGCGKQVMRLRELKRHMSSEHGGFLDEELAQAVGGPVADVATRMSNFAQTIPSNSTEGDGQEQETERGSVDSQRTSTIPPANSPSPVPIGRTVKATPKKLKRVLGSIPKAILEQLGIPLDDEDKDALDESGEFLADVFGVEFIVPESKAQLQWRGWAVIWVLGMVALIYVKHKFTDIVKKVQEGQRVQSDNRSDRTNGERQEPQSSGVNETV